MTLKHTISGVKNLLLLGRVVTIYISADGRGEGIIGQ